MRFLSSSAVMNLGDQFQVRHRLSHRNLELMGVYDSGELTAGNLPVVANRQKVVILSENDTSQAGRACQNRLVVPVRCLILFGCQNIHTTSP